jgi:hypothetical protein
MAHTTNMHRRYEKLDEKDIKVEPLEISEVKPTIIDKAKITMFKHYKVIGKCKILIDFIMFISDMNENYKIECEANKDEISIEYTGDPQTNKKIIEQLKNNENIEITSFKIYHIK